jgi:hypothetical protein
MAALAGPAHAWAHAQFARQAFQAGQPELAAGYLAQAIARNPPLGRERRPELLEFLLTPLLPQALPVNLPAMVARHFPNHLAPSAAELRRAQARVAVAALWRWSGRTSQPGAWPAVRQAYWQGVSHDPRWLGNRGLWSILLRAWAARS